jgi:hypothetical protein
MDMAQRELLEELHMMQVQSGQATDAQVASNKQIMESLSELANLVRRIKVRTSSVARSKSTMFRAKDGAGDGVIAWDEIVLDEGPVSELVTIIAQDYH